MPDVKTYDPAKVLVVLAGLIITGFARGVFVELTPAEASFRDDHGVDGEPIRWAPRNPFDALVITLSQTSQSNSLLSHLRNADLVTHASIFPVRITDLNAEVASNAEDTTEVALPLPSLPSTYVAARGWITGAPSIGYGADPTARRWSLRLLNTLYNVTGSNGLPAVSA